MGIRILKCYLDNVVIDLRSSATREVVLKFEIPENMPPIQGQIRIDRLYEIPENMPPIQRQSRISRLTEGAKRHYTSRTDWLSIENNQASFFVVKRPDYLLHGLHGLSNTLSNRVELGTFNATPLPLGGTYAIMVYEGCTVAVTEPVELDHATPIYEANLQLPQGVTVTGHLLDHNGKPAHHRVSLHIRVKRGNSYHGHQDAEVTPDKDGRFTFKNVHPGKGGTCSVRVGHEKGYRPLRQDIKDLSKPLIIELEKGKRLTGTVIDQATGWPIPGIDVRAQSVSNARGEYSSRSERLEAEEKTDLQGKFEFTNMSGSFYRIYASGANGVAANQPLVIRGGQRDPVTLSVTLPAWSDLRPRKPE